MTWAPDEVALLEEIPPVLRELFIAALYPFAWLLSQVMYRLLQLGCIAARPFVDAHREEIRRRAAS